MNIILLLLLSLVGLSVQAAGDAIQISQAQIDSLGIKLGKPEQASQVPVLYAPAKVVVPPTREYVVSTTQAGLVNRLYAAVGDKVQKGQALAEIYSQDLLALQQQYLKAVNELNLGQAVYNRDKKLLEEGVISDKRSQETRSQYQLYLTEANETRQLLEMAGMSAAEINRLNKTQRLSSLLTLRAPLSGVVLERMASAGQRIDSLAPLYRIADLSELWLEINIPQERIGDVNVGDQVQIDNTAITAHIDLLGQSVNPENQTLMARAIIKGSPATVRVGQKVNTRIIHGSDKTSAFKVPNAAIAQHEGKAYIFIRTDQGFLVRPITVIGKQDSDSIITGELTGAEDIAVTGAVALKANWLGLGGDE
jgi:cobalt-zinc-cadmium efflux system membrane fusion protein